MFYTIDIEDRLRFCSTDIKWFLKLDDYPLLQEKVFIALSTVEAWQQILKKVKNKVYKISLGTKERS